MGLKQKASPRAPELIRGASSVLPGRNKAKPTVQATPLSKKKGAAAEAVESAVVEARGRPRKVHGSNAVYESKVGVESWEPRASVADDKEADLRAKLRAAIPKHGQITSAQEQHLWEREEELAAREAKLEQERIRWAQHQHEQQQKQRLDQEQRNYLRGPGRRLGLQPQKTFRGGHEASGDGRTCRGARGQAARSYRGLGAHQCLAASRAVLG
jgi:hypothetical protein